MGVHLSWFFVKKKRNRGELCAKGRSPRGPPPGTASTPRQGQAGAIHTSPAAVLHLHPATHVRPGPPLHPPPLPRTTCLPVVVGAVPVGFRPGAPIRFRGAAPAPGARGAGAPTRVFRLAARAGGGPGPAPHVRVSRGWVFFPGNESRARHRPGSCADASPSAAASIPFGAFTAARRSRCRLRLSVSGDRGLLPAGLDR